MIVSVLTENLQKKLILIHHVVSTKAQLPILSHVLLEAKENTLVTSATDLELGIEIAIPASVEEPGGIAVPARLFLELINSLGQEKIMLSTKDNSLEIKTKKTKSTLQTVQKEEFPILYDEKGDELFTLNEEDFKNIFSKIVFAACTETTRPALSGVLLHAEKNVFTTVATDGYRLSLEQVSSDMKTQKDFSVLFPARIIQEALILDPKEKVKIYTSGKKNQVLFAQKDITIVGRLIEAEFPNYKKILPTDFSTKVTFDKEEVLKAVKTCAVFAREAANIIVFSFKKDTIIISAKTPSVGENTVETEAKLDGEENQIAFNSRYIQELLGVVKEEEMTFEMSGPLSPGVFKIVGNPSFLHLIMPIRTQE